MTPKSPRATRRNDALAAWIRQAGVSYQELAVALRHTAADQGRSDLRPDRTRIGHWVCHGEPDHPCRASSR
ncbi:hypothetical protein [Embleya sp. NPDC005575]|uniref:hypothetical protein n=1 Tax=Embleya sp. NPDC005575 TaxID=3156892 RepID=UPI0033AEFD52